MDLLDKLRPDKINDTVKTVSDNHTSMVKAGEKKIEAEQVKNKLRYYQQTFNGDPSGNPPYPHMALRDVFAAFVSYKTPDDTRQTPENTVLDLSHVVQALKGDQSDALITTIVNAKDLMEAQKAVADSPVPASLEKYREPIMMAMFQHDDPDLYASYAAPAPAQKEGFSVRVCDSWITAVLLLGVPALIFAWKCSQMWRRPRRNGRGRQLY
jgi:hypothetical protein